MNQQIKALFKFIEFLHSNIQNFNQYDEVISDWVHSSKQLDKSNPNSNDVLIERDIKESFKRNQDIIQKNIQEPIHSKATELNICDINNLETLWNWNIPEINNLKENFSKEDFPEIFEHKKKYIEFRTKINFNEFLLVFFAELDHILIALFDFFIEPDQNEFEAFEMKGKQARSLSEVIRTIKPEHTKLTVSNSQSPLPKNETQLSEKIKKHFGFFNRNCPRQHKQILNSEDFKKLIGWTTFFYENQFEVPEITNPIHIVNTNKTFVQLAFKYLFKELHKSSPYHKNLFTFYSRAFIRYSLDKRSNFIGVRNNDDVKKLMKIEC
jgi:hypothetical protein